MPCNISTPHWCNHHRPPSGVARQCRESKPGTEDVICTRIKGHCGDHASLGFGLTDRDEWATTVDLQDTE